MAIGNLVLTNVGKEVLLADNINEINWATDTIKAILLDDLYTPDVAHAAYSDVSSNEILDADYTQVNLTGKSSTLSGSKVLWDCDNISFGNNVTLAAKYLALVHQAGGSLTTTDVYLGYIDLNIGAGLVATSLNASFAVNTPNGLFDI